MCRRRTLIASTTVLAGLTLITSCGQPGSSDNLTLDLGSPQLEIFGPLPNVVEPAEYTLTPELIDLGRMLYYEVRLSADHDISCNSCHDLENYGVDSEPVSDGHRKQAGDRNSPSVYNAAGHFVQFWDGRAPHVEEQAKGPVMNPVEMAMDSEESVIEELSSIPEYVEAFKKAYPGVEDPISLDTVGQAIGSFERKLLTPSPWDAFLEGDPTALTVEEKAGFLKYMEVGCQGCHGGTYVGGQMFQKMGAAKPWTDTSDPGRYKVTKRESDRMLFKVPSLRNVEKTAPYYHNGSISSLQQAVYEMGEYQLGRILTPQETESIIGWLNTLTGEIPEDYIQRR